MPQAHVAIKPSSAKSLLRIFYVHKDITQPHFLHSPVVLLVELFIRAHVYLLVVVFLQKGQQHLGLLLLGQLDLLHAGFARSLLGRGVKRGLDSLVDLDQLPVAVTQVGRLGQQLQADHVAGRVAVDLPQGAQGHQQAGVVAALAERVQQHARQGAPRLFVGPFGAESPSGADHAREQIPADGYLAVSDLVRHGRPVESVDGEGFEQRKEGIRIRLQQVLLRQAVVDIARLFSLALLVLVEHKCVGRDLARLEGHPQLLKFGVQASLAVVFGHKRKGLKTRLRNKVQPQPLCDLVLALRRLEQTDRPVDQRLPAAQLDKRFARLDHGPCDLFTLFEILRYSGSQHGANQSVYLHLGGQDALCLHEFEHAQRPFEVASADQPLQPLAHEELIGNLERQPRLAAHVYGARKHHVDKDVEGSLGLLGHQKCRYDLVVVLNFHVLAEHLSQ
ncbi:uncharacterized protein PgNI_04919 [Pyricularia grisea]|uniref:Uncharacterized protein n=1 Tax=Pyricularia grisea TaxID=148305 RepID=A0A6P8B8N1_PYRGI|nr:uncharacterized protein PgNI_04919 [Pyricularia grisea]TLD12183.1 hypothetical protein PgNI_04919 [Pyricularia grisea]